MFRPVKTDIKGVLKNYQSLIKQQNIAKNEMKIKYDESTQKVSFDSGKCFSYTEQVVLVAHTLGTLMHKHCEYYENTQEERYELLEAVFKDIKELFEVLDIQKHFDTLDKQ